MPKTEAAEPKLEVLIEEITALTEDDRKELQRLRGERVGRIAPKVQLSPGDRAADRIATLVGSWRFVITQSILLTIWLILNIIAWSAHWDPYPFILLNLMLSFQSAYTAPIILMSQNRQAALDRQTQLNDYAVNLKAGLEIELLHHKLDMLRSREIERLTKIIEELSSRLAEERG